MEKIDDDTGDNNGDAHIFMDRMRFRHGKHQTPIAQENTHDRIQCLSGRRQNIVEKSVPEKEL
jgi:hypothetical protein